MHSGHYNALKKALEVTFGVEMSKIGDDMQHKWKESSVKVLDQILENWRGCVPRDYNRKPQGLSMISKYKMREMYVTGTKLIPALEATKPGIVRRDDAGPTETFDFNDMSEIQRKYFENLKYLTVGLRLVSPIIMDPMPVVSSSGS